MGIARGAVKSPISREALWSAALLRRFWGCVMKDTELRKVF
jgi:hypothetical protein